MNYTQYPNELYTEINLYGVLLLIAFALFGMVLADKNTFRVRENGRRRSPLMRLILKTFVLIMMLVSYIELTRAVGTNYILADTYSYIEISRSEYEALEPFADSQKGRLADYQVDSVLDY